MSQWRDDGHVDDASVAAFVDGQLELLEDGALQHLTECSVCAERIAEASLLAVDVAEAFGELGASRPVQRPLPWVALAAAVLLAGLGATPRALAGVGEAAGDAMRLVPAVYQVARVAWGALSSGTSGVWLSWLTSALLVGVGLWIARRMPLQVSSVAAEVAEGDVG